MQTKDNETLIKRIENIFANTRYASDKKLSPEHIEEFKRVIGNNKTVAVVVSALCDAFDKSNYEAVANAKSLVELVRLHQTDFDEGIKMMTYLAGETELETEPKRIN